MIIDDELKSLAAQVLRNALYRDLDNLVANYIEAAEGTGADAEMFYEVHAFGSKKTPNDLYPNINTSWPAPVLFGPDYRGSCGHTCIIEALEHEPAQDVYVQGRKVFEKRDGEWFYVEQAP